MTTSCATLQVVIFVHNYICRATAVPFLSWLSGSQHNRRSLEKRIWLIFLQLKKNIDFSCTQSAELAALEMNWGRTKSALTCQKWKEKPKKIKIMVNEHSLVTNLAALVNGKIGAGQPADTWGC
jgi:hypothetical protein